METTDTARPAADKECAPRVVATVGGEEGAGARFRTVLMIAYFYPPIGGLGVPGAQRASRFSKHLPAFGWRPVILTARESSYEPYLTRDGELARRLDPGAPIVRSSVFRGLSRLLEWKNAHRSSDAGSNNAVLGEAAQRSRQRSGYQRFKDAITDLFEIPDEEAGWLLPGVAAGWQAIRRYDVDVVFATGRPWSALVIGLLLKRLTGKPLVVEFRDPWMTNPFRIDYSPLKNFWDGALEKRVVKGADLILASTDELQHEFATRFGAEVGAKCVTMLNGFDRDEFAGIAPENRDAGTRRIFVLMHAGFLYGHRDPAPFLAAIKLLKDRGVIAPGTLRCELLGPVQLGYDLAVFVRSEGLEAEVVLRGQVTHDQSLRAVVSCDVALLLQPGTDTQIPSKLYEYIGAGKRVLAVARTNSASAKIVRDYALGVVADADSVEDIAAAIERCYLDWRERRDATPTSAAFDALDIRHRASDLAEQMTKLANGHRSE